MIYLAFIWCNFLKMAKCRNRMVAGANAGNHTNGKWVNSDSPGPPVVTELMALTTAITSRVMMSSEPKIFHA